MLYNEYSTLLNLILQYKAFFGKLEAGFPILTFEGVRYVVLNEATVISCVVYRLGFVRLLHRYSNLSVILYDAVPLAPSRATKSRQTS